MSSETADPPTETVDVRTIDGPPFETIVNALDGLAGDETLLLISAFEPEPLYDVLDRRGFAYETTRVAEGEFHVRIEPA